jgi:hypothetical protein
MIAASQIPNPAHTLAESMLSRRFGKETVNYFSSTSGMNVHECCMGSSKENSKLTVNRLSNQPVVVPAK